MKKRGKGFDWSDLLGEKKRKRIKIVPIKKKQEEEEVVKDWDDLFVVEEKKKPKSKQRVNLLGNNTVESELLAWLKTSSTGCWLITGPTGCGKTTFIQNFIKNQGFLPIYVDAVIDGSAGKDRVPLLKKKFDYAYGHSQGFSLFGKKETPILVIDNAQSLFWPQRNLVAWLNGAIITGGESRFQFYCAKYIVALISDSQDFWKFKGFKTKHRRFVYEFHLKAPKPEEILCYLKSLNKFNIDEKRLKAIAENCDGDIRVAKICLENPEAHYDVEKRCGLYDCLEVMQDRNIEWPRRTDAASHFTNKLLYMMQENVEANYVFSEQLSIADTLYNWRHPELYSNYAVAIMDCRKTAKVKSRKYPYHFSSLRNKQWRYRNEFQKMHHIPAQDQFYLHRMVDMRKDVLLDRKINFNTWKKATKISMYLHTSNKY